MESITPLSAGGREAAARACLIVADPVADDRRQIRGVDILNLVCIEYEGSRLLVQLDSGGDGVKTVADHPRRVFDREIHRYRNINLANYLLELVL